MIDALSRKVIVGIAMIMALFWTLTLGLVYALLATTDDLWHWVNTLIAVPPDLAHWLQAVVAWLGQLGGWTLIVVWALGLALIAVLTLFARRLTKFVPPLRREGGLS